MLRYDIACMNKGKERLWVHTWCKALLKSYACFQAWLWLHAMIMTAGYDGGL